MDAAEIASVSDLLQEMETSISSDIGITEKKVSQEEMKKFVEDVKVKLEPLRRSRGTVKRKITLLFKQLLDIVKDESDSFLLSSILEEISVRLEEVKKYDMEIEALITASDIHKYDQSLLDEELIGATHYHLLQQRTINKFRPPSDSVSRRSSASAVHQLKESNQQQFEVPSMFNNLMTRQEVKIPPLKCKTFSGESDRFQFRTFMISFENVIGCRRDLTEASKLQYLKSHLTGLALKDVEHLPNINENYEIALRILKDLYLDENFIVDSILHQIYTAPAIENKNLEAIRTFVSEVRAHLHELKEFGLDFSEEESAGSRLLSHIVVDKLPPNFLRELKIVTQVEYPSINIIFDHYHTIIKSMERIKGKFTSSSSRKSSSSSSVKKTSSYHSSNKYSVQERTTPSKKSDLSNEMTSVKCKLCEGAHFMSSCTVYTTQSARRERCNAIGLCSCCSSTKHFTSACPAKRYGLSHPCVLCHSKTHITALCSSGAKSKIKKRPQVKDDPSTSSSPSDTPAEENILQNHLCINTGSSPSGNILPTISLKIRRGNKIVVVRSLIDFGSQRSYFHSRLLERLEVDLMSLPRRTCNIKTFLGEQFKTLYSIELELNICCDSFVKIPALIDPEIDIGFEVKGLMGAEYNIRHNGFHIADRFFYQGRHGDSVSNVDCLLGIDVLYMMKHFKIVNCLKGSAIESCHGFIPFGPVKSFLTPSQIETIFKINSIQDQEEGLQTS